jgi:hypothetical protein
MRNADAPASYSFSMDLPPGAALVGTDDGGLDVIPGSDDGFAQALAHVDPPWARDSQGQMLPTLFSVEGHDLVQHVDARGATYPVTADPKITWGWITGTVYFNKSETRKLAAVNTAASVLAAALPAPFKVAVIPLGALAVRAQWALADNKCIKIKLPALRFDSYRGGYCT